jgi:hypothetical protein
MNCLFAFVLNTVRWRILVMPILCLFMPQHAGAALSHLHMGSDVTVHYVRLTGYGGDNDANRKQLLADHYACTEHNKFLKKPSAPLSAAAVPAIPQPFDIEVYYSANRILTLVQGKLYYIDDENCKLEAKPHHHIRVNSYAGECNTDLVMKVARGQCDDNAHLHAPVPPPQYSIATERPAMDMTGLPSAISTPVQAQLNALATYAGTKTILGMKCSISQAKSLDHEACIAHPPSSFVIPAGSINGPIPGLLLELKDRAMTLEAQELGLEKRVSQSLFAVPKGVKVIQLFGAKP